MEFWQKMSAAVAIAGPAVVLSYDVFAMFVGGRKATITFVIQEWSRTFHELPFITAALLLWLWLHLFAVLLLEESAKK